VEEEEFLSYSKFPHILWKEFFFLFDASPFGVYEFNSLISTVVHTTYLLLIYLYFTTTCFDLVADHLQVVPPN
jgi:hypothetical protein